MTTPWKDITGPVWKDLCQHPDGSYVGSFEVYSFKAPSGPHTVEQYDLYVFHHPASGLPQTQVCLRFGADSSQYYSFTSIPQLIRSSQHGEPYWSASQLLEARRHIAADSLVHELYMRGVRA